MECNVDLNRTRCTCTYEPCSRKGRCCDCITYHLRMDELPGCVFPAEAERTYNRSKQYFVRIYANR